MNIPNLLTLVRIAAIPVIVVLFYLPPPVGHWLATLVFIIASITDWLDGYLARNLQQTTKFGAFLDPVADKLLVAVVLVLIVGEKGMPYLAIPAAVIVGREIVVSALREWMAEYGKRASMAVSKIAKVKTVIQMVALVVLLVARPGEDIVIRIIGYILIYIAAVLTLWSMFLYLKVAWPELRNNHNAA